MIPQTEQVEAIHTALQRVKARPGMYFGSNLPAALNFLMGFFVACRALGLDLQLKTLTEQVSREKGWRTTFSYGPHRDMMEKGLSEDEIADELLAIEVEVLRRWLDDHQ